jgi:hypothetical protein
MLNVQGTDSAADLRDRPKWCATIPMEGCTAGTGASPRRIMTMAKSQRKSNKEVRKPKAEKVKTIAANASTKDNPVGMVTIRK